MENEFPGGQPTPEYANPFNPYYPPVEPAPPGYQWHWDEGQGGWVILPIVQSPESLPAPTIDPPGGPVDPYQPIPPMGSQPEPEPDPYGGGGYGGTDYGAPNPYVPPPAAPAAPAAPAPSGGGQQPGGSFFTPFQPPETPAPSQFTAPPPFSYAPFQYQPFKAPSLQDALSEPGYQFAFDEGRKALENSAAARGTLRTGGTLKDLMRWGQGFAQQNYDNVFNRSMKTHETGFNNAFDTWLNNRENAAKQYSMNYGVSRDTFDRNTDQLNLAFDRNYGRARDVFNSLREGEKLTFDDLYKRWQQLLTTNVDLALLNV